MVERTLILVKLLFKNLEITYPPIKEQKIIVGILSLVQNAIAQQEKAIALTTELKDVKVDNFFLRTEKLNELFQTLLHQLGLNYGRSP